MLDDALSVLLADDLAHVVALVLCRRGETLEAHARAGSVTFDRQGVLRTLRGVDPLANGDLTALGDVTAERTAAARDASVYPFAYDNAGQLFDDPRAPDMAVVHTGSHNWQERGGHVGEHGSLALIQSRAPLILSGAGIRRDGTVARAARMVDVAPTLARLCGVEPPPGDGSALEGVLDPETRPDKVVVFLWDGTNAMVAYAMAAAGELPNLARLMADGTTFAHGLIASFPSVTLANHTTALTGLHPGHHGVLHNVYFDRATGRQIVTNAPETWHMARTEISSRAETIFETLARAGRRTVCINEPSDRGATYATFDLVRAAGEHAAGLMQTSLPDPAGIEHATTAFVERSREYAWSSAADALAVQQVRDLWLTDPALMWVNLILPDAAGHAGGPYSDIGTAGLRDTDARLGEMLDAMDQGGGRTTFMVLADHGMQETDPTCKGDFDVALTRAGIPFRDEGYGFIYLNA